ncbi:MAG: hypothetical protein HQ580_02305 [Planctomycetes bacterium]|nr:hypothetical protein [Planctomycetota bacterium]
MDRRISVFVIICLVATTIAIGGVEHVGSARVLAQSWQDNACGPRCLWALMQLTNVGKADCDVEYIYGLIGRPSSSPVNLKDLKDAAKKLGFEVHGQSLSIAKLKEMDGYAILPIGNSDGTKDRPLHFVLVAGVTAELALVVDTNRCNTGGESLNECRSCRFTGAANFCNSLHI